MVNLLDKLEQYRREESKLAWEGTFGEYFELVTGEPGDRAAVARADLPDAGGGGGGGGGRAQAVRVLRRGPVRGGEAAAAAGRVLQLGGAAAGGAQAHPAADGAGRRAASRRSWRCSSGAWSGTRAPRRGRSTRSRAARCTRSRCTWCPEALRAELQTEYGLYIEGDLCPVCRHALRGAVRRRGTRTCRSSGSSSPRRRACGIGTFSPSDPKSQDITELTGSIDLSTIGEYGVESRPAGLPLRRRAEHRQPGPDGVRRDAQVRREVPLRRC